VNLTLVLLSIAVASATLATPANPPPCKVTENQLIGYWVGSGPFEEMQFAKEDGVNVFNSWLHEHPDYYGARWTYGNCHLKILRDDEPLLTYNFLVKSAGRILVLVDLDDHIVSKYRRLKL
jgi:hypothetical protein